MIGTLENEPCQGVDQGRLDAGRMAEEVRAGHARVNHNRPDVRAGHGEPALQLEGEQHVGELAVAVCLTRAVRAALPIQIVQIEPPGFVQMGGDGDDAVGDVWQQPVGQGEVTEVVRTDMPLEAIAACGASSLRRNRRIRCVN